MNTRAKSWTSDTWQAERVIEVLPPAQVPDSEPDSWTESRDRCPVMSDVPAPSDLITSGARPAAMHSPARLMMRAWGVQPDLTHVSHYL
ncbi:phage tail terminator protein [Escherichia coli]